MTATDVLSQLRALLPGDDQPTLEETWDFLRHRVTILSARTWEGRNDWPAIERWLQNFDGRSGHEVGIERLHALFLLSQFLYIGSVEIRVLQRAMFRDLFVIPLLAELRRELGTGDLTAIEPAFEAALNKTRFLGVGNPAESGVHLLYYFRQENRLEKDRFLDSAQIFMFTRQADDSFVHTIADCSIMRYVFVDDVCGSGQTAIDYSQGIVSELLALQPDAKVFYFAMFATADGIDRVRRESLFGSRAAAIFELDESYKCVSPASRYLRAPPPHIDPTVVRAVAERYGEMLWREHPLGWEDGQMLLGFHHNTPDNTLPIIWDEGRSDGTLPWTPVFRRYPKLI